jgi:hypothetical protein
VECELECELEGGGNGYTSAEAQRVAIQSNPTEQIAFRNHLDIGSEDTPSGDRADQSNKWKRVPSVYTIVSFP